MAETRYVGRSYLWNVDGEDKVAGRARFVADLRFPDMLHAAVLRVSVPHARIRALDVAPALDVPGVQAVITAEDFVDHGNFGWPVKDAYVLAHRKVRYLGEAVAAVAATTPQAAQAGVAAIRLGVLPLPVVTDPAQARDPTAPLIPPTSPTGEHNLCARHIVRNGDPVPLLEASPVRFTASYDLPHQEHAYLETEGVVALPTPGGGVELYANNQSPFINRATVAQVLGLAEEQVRVIQPPIGGAFGGKDDVLYGASAQAAKLALLTGRPVRLIFSRSESLLASYKRQAMTVTIDLAATREGELQAAQVHQLIDNGAYAAATPLSSWRAAMHAAGAYRYQAVHVDTEAVYTNNGYAGAFRGFGNTQATAAIEMAVDELAERLGQDPLEFRLRNCLQAGDRTMTGNELTCPVGLAACLRWVREHSEWDRKRVDFGAAAEEEKGLRRGIGVACYFHGSGLGGEGEDFAIVTLRVEDDNRITIHSGLSDFGQGSRTVFSLLAAELLGVGIETISMARPDTETTLDSGPTVASRSSIVGGNAVRVAAGELNQMLRLAAADYLGCAPEQVSRISTRATADAFACGEAEVSWGVVVSHARTMGLDLQTVGRWQVPDIEWEFETGTGVPYFCYVFGAQVVEVAVDARDRVKVTGIWAAHDAGTILYPQGALGQFYGGIAQGLGYGLMEGFTYRDGVPQKTTLARYRIPRATDLPDIEATYIETALHEGPFGAKNLAEPVMIGTAPALANAYAHATGRRPRTLPVGK